MQPGDDTTTGEQRINVMTNSLDSINSFDTNLEEVVLVGQRVPSQGLLLALET